MNRKKLDDILMLVNRLIVSHGYDCLEADWAVKDRTLRLYIGKSNDAIKLSDCVEVNNILKDCVELDDSINGPYSLEVSSPGLDRPLRLVKHYEEAVGEMVRVNMKEGGQKKAIVGRLVDVQPLEITLETKEGRKAISLEVVLRARVVHD